MSEAALRPKRTGAGCRRTVTPSVDELARLRRPGRDPHAMYIVETYEAGRPSPAPRKKYPRKKRALSVIEAGEFALLRALDALVREAEGEAERAQAAADRARAAREAFLGGLTP